MESPSRFRPNTTSEMAMPGNRAIQGARSRLSVAAVSMPPQEGSSGGDPRPRKLSAASTTMA